MQLFSAVTTIFEKKIVHENVKKNKLKSCS
jgi:hypothetical protein